jgi:hypothetical protein
VDRGGVGGGNHLTGVVEPPHHRRSDHRQGEFHPLLCWKIHNPLAPSCSNAQRSCAGVFMGPTFTIASSSPSLPHTGQRHRSRTPKDLRIDAAGIVLIIMYGAGCLRSGSG